MGPKPNERRLLAIVQQQACRNGRLPRRYDPDWVLPGGWLGAALTS